MSSSATQFRVTATAASSSTRSAQETLFPLLPLLLPVEEVSSQDSVVSRVFFFNALGTGIFPCFGCVGSCCFCCCCCCGGRAGGKQGGNVGGSFGGCGTVDGAVGGGFGTVLGASVGGFVKMRGRCCGFGASEGGGVAGIRTFVPRVGGGGSEGEAVSIAGAELVLTSTSGISCALAPSTSLLKPLSLTSRFSCTLVPWTGPQAVLGALLAMLTTCTVRPGKESER
mmetsp:Transcript_73015/g.159662  ORF Transcript_73015/g.159662 Transcript_73015/m.159662 type:complete len:226 (-) Transcript_73015:332-1009(-)